MKPLLIRKLKNFIGLKLMSFFIKNNFRLITMCNERVFEYPWVLMRCNAKRGDKIGDFGCKGSMMVPYLSSQGFEVYGVDLAEGLDFSSHFLDNYQNFRFVKSDIRKMPFPDNFFDVSFSISTLEHIFSNDKACEDKAALQEIVRVTKSGAQILLTFPYGSGNISKEYIGYPYKIYNEKSLKEFLDIPELILEDIDYFIKKAPIWIKAKREDIEGLDNTIEIRGTVCVSLKKHKEITYG